MYWRWECIAELMIVHGMRTGCELGVKEGRFTEYILKHIPDSKMWAVDLWEAGHNEFESYEDWPMEFYYLGFKQMVSGYRDRVNILRCSTNDAVGHVPDVDFVFIDADHSHYAVCNDIRNWGPKAKTLLCGHDYHLPSVREPIQALLGKVEQGPNNVWLHWK